MISEVNAGCVVVKGRPLGGLGSKKVTPPRVGIASEEVTTGKLFRENVIRKAPTAKIRMPTPVGMEQ